MATTLREKIASLSPERQARLKARTQELITEEIVLQKLRKAPVGDGGPLA